MGLIADNNVRLGEWLTGNARRVVIIENCREVSTLRIDYCSLVEQYEFLTSQKKMSKLKFLTILCNLEGPDNNIFNPNNLTSLLSSPELCKVSINYVDNDADVDNDAGNRNQFLKLENVELHIA